MKKLIIIGVLAPFCVFAQGNPVTEVVEGGKALVELIKIFKSPRQKLKANVNEESSPVADSCATLQRSDLCFKNATGNSLIVSIYKRNGDSYAAQPFTIKILSQNEECWYEMKAGIYKYRIEIDAGLSKSVMREGEFRLEACENMQREITE